MVSKAATQNQESLDQASREQLNRLRDALKVGEEQADRGDFVALDMSELIEGIKAEAPIHKNDQTSYKRDYLKASDRAPAKIRVAASRAAVKPDFPDWVGAVMVRVTGLLNHPTMGSRVIWSPGKRRTSSRRWR